MNLSRYINQFFCIVIYKVDKRFEDVVKDTARYSVYVSSVFSFTQLAIFIVEYLRSAYIMENFIYIHYQVVLHARKFLRVTPWIRRLDK